LLAENDEPLVGFEVKVTLLDGTVQKVRTRDDGSWLIEALPPGDYVIDIQQEGFEPVSRREQVGVGEVTDVTYRIVPLSTGLEVLITGERPPREVTRRTISREQIRRVPGTGGDALRSLQSLPGVARAPFLAGLLIVRGQAPQDTQTFVDGGYVPLIYHFGGLSSTVPTELLDSIDFYPGNFSARYGQVMGGIVDVKLRSPDTSCQGPYGAETEEKRCFNGMAQVDFIDTRLLLQGPIGEDWSFAIAGRRSWVDLWLKPALEAAEAGVTSAPVYYDYQMIAETEPTKDSKLSIRFYGSDDRLELLLRDPGAQEPGFGGNLTFGSRTAMLDQETSCN
jgi:outer membrane receptor protein involved in Fe transport